MSKQKASYKTETKAEQLAKIQKVGYLTIAEFELFCDIAKKINLRLDKVKMGEALQGRVDDVKFYTDSK